MSRALEAFAVYLMVCGAAILSVTAARARIAGQSGPAAPPPAQAAPVPALTPFIDTHVHFDGDTQTVLQAALQALPRQNAVKFFFMPPPDTFDTPNRQESDVLLPVVRRHPDRLAILAGGGTLNAIIQQAIRSGDTGPEVQGRFRERAEEIIRIGGIGFGEMTSEHFASATPYQTAPNDHPLFLLLADIAAQHDAPIVLHMEAAPEDMPTPPQFRAPNPPRIPANLASFQRLLAHNRRARIVWAHLGSDSLGHRNPALTRRLLQAHSNLFLEIKADPANPRSNYPLDANGKLKPDWLQLFLDFPDRFVVGSDQHYPESRATAQRWQAVVHLLNQLPADVRQKIGTENVARIYPLSLRRPAN
jgi:predicted TIM-barrel fold metal-dependent hydrolase